MNRANTTNSMGLESFKFMRVIFLILIGFTVNAQQQFQLSQLSHWNDPNIPVIDGDQRWNDITGWNDTIKNKEYLIAGSNDSIYFFDISNPLQMILCDVMDGHSKAAINRDYETYSHYLYCVSDRSSPTGSLQIFDLQYLPDSVHLVYDYDSLSINTHTLFIDAPSKRLYLCGNSYKPAGLRSMAVLDLTNPEQPILLGELDKSLGCSYTHEVYIRKDTAYCSCGYEGLYIVDMHDLKNQKLLGSITAPYPQSGFNHSSWLDSTGKYLMFTDENQGLGIKIYNISQISDPAFLTVFNSHPGALPHNAYWKDGFAYVSSYEDGVYVYDLRNIYSFTMGQQPPIAAWFDTYTKNADGVYHGFHGCWGVWPYLKSGLVIASDISEGLFVLKPSPNMGLKDVNEYISNFNISNPAESDGWNISFKSKASTEMAIQLFDISGRELSKFKFNISSGPNHVTLPSEGLPQGIYMLHAKINSQIIYSKLVR